MKTAIVVPCHILLSEAWVAALKAEAKAHKAQVVIVDDSDGKLGKVPFRWEVLGYKKQERFLGDLYPEFARLFHKQGACRMVGHLWAYAHGYDVIIGLDSDCIAPTHFIRDHLAFIGKEWGSGWFNTIGYPDYPRGYPYSQRGWKVVANMGLWKNVLDINGKDRKEGEPTEIRLMGSTVPNDYFPFCGMNFALEREAALGYLFIPNFDIGDDHFRRVDDIWGGYIFQKLLRMLHQSTIVGFPVVYHDTIVNAEEDARDEAAMYEYEDRFFAAVDLAVDNITTLPVGKITMRAFITEFAESWRRVGQFTEIQPALDWWVKAISKYA